MALFQFGNARVEPGRKLIDSLEIHPVGTVFRRSYKAPFGALGFILILAGIPYSPLLPNALAGSNGSSAPSASSLKVTGGAKVQQEVRRQSADGLLAYRVKTTIGDDHVHVSAHKGVVTLRGHVASRKVSERAGRVAARVPGVKTVRNRLTYPTHAH